MDNYDLVLEYLLSEGYSHKEATRIMVDEGIIQDLWKAAQKRFSSPKNIARAGAADVAATAIASTPANTVRPALPPQPAPIVRTVAAPVTPNPLQQVAAPFKKVRNIVRQLNPAKPTAGSLPQGKSGGSVVTASKPGSVTPSAKPASGISNASGSSSVATRGGGQVSPSGASVRTPGGPLAKAGPVVDVQSRLSGTPSVQRIAPSKVRNFKPSVKVTPPTKVTPTRGGGSPISAVVTALLDLQGSTPQTRTPAQTAERERRIQAKWGDAMNKTPSKFGKAGPDVTRPKGMSNIPPSEAQPGSPSYVAPTQSRPPASKEPEKKPEVKQVVTKKNVVAPVVKKPAPAKPVDPRLQKYRDLVKKGKRLEAETLGREIYQSTYGAPAFRPTKTA